MSSYIEMQSGPLCFLKSVKPWSASEDLSSGSSHETGALSYMLERLIFEEQDIWAARCHIVQSWTNAEHPTRETSGGK